MLARVLRYLDDRSLINAAFATKRFMSVCKGDPILRKRITEIVLRQKRLHQQAAMNVHYGVEIMRSDVSHIFGTNQGKKVRAVVQEPVIPHHVSRRNSFSRTFEDHRKRGGGKLRNKCKKRAEPYKTIRL
ncbi:hypothetical protein FQR65_LT02524 [Abscondita terminalis]|nr:hypothetical protein FQR65_LT02524 [Abscondita terminalis]